MNHYSNRGGNSNVQGYEIGDDFITIYFKKSNKPYTYSYRSASEYHIEKMKKLATEGSGLNSYIMLNVKNDFER
ncbi:MAG: hypothetical protein A3D92_00130 [Bacteroidetes bacterium RIFCSPHIGHO2_02_FULL_44_7]|nr:MAG: hypothetical protein A3D92_00130 [Bacteroidetes bacterium RIFCSPHIGHO2_02_FULL_44_7]